VVKETVRIRSVRFCSHQSAHWANR